MHGQTHIRFINSFSDSKHLLQENYCILNTNIFFFVQNITQDVFYKKLYTSTCAPFVARRTSNWQSVSLHVCSNMSSVIVAKESVILAFKFVISGTGVKNILSLTYPHKKKSRGWYPAIAVARVSYHLSQSTCVEILHPKVDEHMIPSVEMHHRVG